MKVTLNAMTKPIETRMVVDELSTPMNPEEYLIYCARVSSPENRLNHETAPKLLKYLIDSGHWSPFEMISIGIEIETSRAIGTQLLRHRSFSFQEFSQRYSEVEKIEPIEIRRQAMKNRQSSSASIHNKIFNNWIEASIRQSKETYHKLVAHGVAKECARMVLPQTTQTTIVMHGTLRSWIHFFDQRCSDHAQKEIRLIALWARREISKVCPWTSTALNWVKK